MKTTLVITVLAASIGVANAADGIMIEILATFPDNLLGNGLLAAHASGFLNGVNGMAFLAGTLPENGDLANNEPIDNFVRMTRQECKSHPDMTFSNATVTILSRIKDRAAKEDKQ